MAEGLPNFSSEQKYHNEDPHLTSPLRGFGRCPTGLEQTLQEAGIPGRAECFRSRLLHTPTDGGWGSLVCRLPEGEQCHFANDP